MTLSDLILLLPIWNVLEGQTWMVAILCCSYILPATSFDHFRARSVYDIQSPSEEESRSATSHSRLALLNSTLRDINEVASFLSKDNIIEEDNQNQVGVMGETGLLSALLTNLLSETDKLARLNSKLDGDQQLSYWAQDKHLIGDSRGRPHKRFINPYERKVFVHGKDDRLRIYPSLQRKFPYSNVVRLSTGCTGTLVTPQHVLTAAHCIHTGSDFKDNLEKMKVEIPDSMGARDYYMAKVGIPGKWLHPKKLHEYQASWDYAVVKLSYSVHGRSQFFPLAVPTDEILSENLQFLGFPNNKDDLWLSVCPARSNKVMVDGNLILTECDSALGNSGAAVLSDDSRDGKKIIGVLSSKIPAGRKPHYTPFSVITALTWTKLYDICAEIGETGVQHRVCPPLPSIPRPRRYSYNNNVIPFFG